MVLAGTGAGEGSRELQREESTKDQACCVGEKLPFEMLKRHLSQITTSDRSGWSARVRPATRRPLRLRPASALGGGRWLHVHVCSRSLVCLVGPLCMHPHVAHGAPVDKPRSRSFDPPQDPRLREGDLRLARAASWVSPVLLQHAHAAEKAQPRCRVHPKGVDGPGGASMRLAPTNARGAHQNANLVSIKPCPHPDPAGWGGGSRRTTSS